MKLIIAIAHEREKHRLTDELVEQGMTYTQIGSTGGFLRQGNVTLLIGVEDADVGRVMDIIKTACGAAETFVNIPGEAVTGPLAILGAHPPHPIKTGIGGAVAFVLNVDDFRRF